MQSGFLSTHCLYTEVIVDMKGRFSHVFRSTLKWVFIFILLAVAGSAIYHYAVLNSERRELGAAIPGDTFVSVSGRRIHASVYGKQDAPVTLVFLHGLGNGDCTVSTRAMFAPLSSACQICVIDRPGAGLSKSTDEPRSIDAIVGEYRTALKQFGISGKLVLVAHSIAGMYADFWACSYPAEVSGIVYIDATLSEIYVEQGEEPFMLKLASAAKTASCFTGLQRFLVGDSTLIRRDYKNVFSSRDQELRRMLMFANTWSPATYSEKVMACRNAGAALSVMKQTAGFSSLPKLYFEADTYHGEYFESVASAGVKAQYGFTDDSQLAAWVAGADERRQAEYDRIAALGNVTLVKVSGPHTLYEYAPDVLSEEIAAFVAEL